MVPLLMLAITDFKAEEEYAEWVEPFVIKLVEICRPGHRITLDKIEDPQEEETKDPLTFKQKLY